MSAPGLYVHVPFCSALCPYCDFAVVVGRAADHGAYLDAVLREAEARAKEIAGPFGSVFVGGGTPSFVDPALLSDALRRVRTIVEIAPDAEVTIEANPESVDDDRARAWLDAGINRISIGAQSFDDEVLRGLGRTHTAAQIRRSPGAGNVSFDLIYGAPGESIDSWRATVEATIALEPQHVSAYALTIEERTAFGSAVARGRMTEPDHDDLAAKYEIACDLLERAGFEHYEISNWARPGFRSRHNLVYWTQGDYLGLGLGAHSHRAGTRMWNTRSLSRYLDDPTGAGEGSEVVDNLGEEWLSLRMRLLEPLDLATAEARTGRDLRAVAKACEALGLARLEDGSMRLTRRGMLLENEVTLRLLDA